MSTEIEGLVSRLRDLKSGDTGCVQVPNHELESIADALSQTIPRTDGDTITVSRMTLEWIAKKCADKRNPQVAFVVSKLLAGEALSALRGMADDAQTIPRTTDEAMRDAGEFPRPEVVECVKASRRDFTIVGRSAKHGTEWFVDSPEQCAAGEFMFGPFDTEAEARDHMEMMHARAAIKACLAAMRRVSKTDEGRNAVIEECARAAHAKRSECDEAFYETNGSIYTEAYLDGISAAYDAIRALTTGGN